MTEEVPELFLFRILRCGTWVRADDEIPGAAGLLASDSEKDAEIITRHLCKYFGEDVEMVRIQTAEKWTLSSQA